MYGGEFDDKGALTVLTPTTCSDDGGRMMAARDIENDPGRIVETVRGLRKNGGGVGVPELHGDPIGENVGPGGVPNGGA